MVVFTNIGGHTFFFKRTHVLHFCNFRFVSESCGQGVLQFCHDVHLLIVRFLGTERSPHLYGTSLDKGTL